MILIKRIVDMLDLSNQVRCWSLCLSGRSKGFTVSIMTTKKIFCTMASTDKILNMFCSHWKPSKLRFYEVAIIGSSKCTILILKCRKYCLRLLNLILKIIMSRLRHTVYSVCKLTLYMRCLQSRF